MRNRKTKNQLAEENAINSLTAYGIAPKGPAKCQICGRIGIMCRMEFSVYNNKSGMVVQRKVACVCGSCMIKATEAIQEKLLSVSDLSTFKEDPRVEDSK